MAKTKQFYFNKEDMKNLGAKDSVSEYMKGIIHQDKILFVQVVVLPRIGLAQGSPFKPLDKNGKPALETGLPWESFEVPTDSKKVKVEKKDGKKEVVKRGKGKKS